MYININIYRYRQCVCVTKQSERSKRLGSTVRVGYSRLESDIVSRIRLHNSYPYTMNVYVLDSVQIQNKHVKSIDDISIIEIVIV